jgi:hypothetical protein
MGRLPNTTELRKEDLPWEESELPDSESEENCNCKLLREADGVDWSTYRHYQHQNGSKKRIIKMGMRSEEPKEEKKKTKCIIRVAF